MSERTAAGSTRRLLADTDRSLAGIGAIADGLLQGERPELLPVCLLAAQVSASR